ncbi:NEUROGENIC LOCUS NOTCH-like protein 3-LIKE [Salix koriyanagi]|uniref:NEUROGENIC LOCUS NOTCH-like protein 3-LIKE n=1 Tax=Salix koriyanagi TaxID=2511006 RepID=A0A9Q0PXH6_9ROSI|nr:NEUROGENIC LOCUS NOTCH-like protein 3-LIKE [Salix koriyanagi]
MNTFNLISTPISFNLLLSSLLALTVKGTLQDDVCALTNCGEGACKASSASLLGFDCECYSGWKKVQIGPLTFPSCIIPNCTVDFGCGNGAPPPPPPSRPPPFDLLNPCNLVWCGDGTCVANGTGHICQCTGDSANLFNLTGLACFKKCYLGADCNGLVLGKSPPSPPPPAPTSSATPVLNGTGLFEASNSSKHLSALSLILLAATFLKWL